MSLQRLPIKSNDVRLPEPQLGEAFVVERYSAKNIKAVVLHPDDFAELQGDADLLDELTAAPALSNAAAKAHELAEAPEGKLIDDAASVKRLLDL